MNEVLEFLSSDPLLLYPLLFLLGTIVGSFLNVCIYRLPDETKSLVKPGSYCPGCKTPIKWHYNLPIVSYILLRGKASCCDFKIPISYFLVELTTGLLFVGFVNHFGFYLHTFFLIGLFAALLVASVIDFKMKIIPDEITLYGMLIGLGLGYFFPEFLGESDPRLGIANSIIGLLVGGGVIYLIAIIGDYIFKKESMGGGDIKLLAMIGSFLGWKLAVFGFLLSPYFAIGFALYAKFCKKEATIPYGPFLSLGAFAALLFGNQILGIIGI